MTNACCVAADASGNLFITDFSDGLVEEILARDGYTTVKTLASGFVMPNGIDLDGSGHVFVSEWGRNRLVILDYADPPSLTFGKTSVGVESSDSPQTVTVSNNGNAALTFPIPSAGRNPSISSGFTLDSATTCPDLSISSATGKLAAGTSCDYAMDFIPVALATYSGSLTLIDNNLNAVSPGYAMQSIALNGRLPNPFGYIDMAVDSVTGSTTVGQSHSLKVSGWVADATDGAPLSNVKVYIDGVSIGAPTLGIARPDVASAYNNNAYLNSGYRLLYPASSLSLGRHKVTVIAIDSGGRWTTFGPSVITVQ